jgi:hypothetical protein
MGLGHANIIDTNEQRMVTLVASLQSLRGGIDSLVFARSSLSPIANNAFLEMKSECYSREPKMHMRRRVSERSMK